MGTKANLRARAGVKAEEREIAVTLKSSGRYRRWLANYAKFRNLPVSILVDLCLRKGAEADGYPVAPPRNEREADK
jgi:hypothetical protein